MTKKDRYEKILDWFTTHVPEAETELLYDNAFQLLVAVILSAQCTDKRVNATTPFIFEKYPDVVALSKANFDDLFSIIKSISDIRGTIIDYDGISDPAMFGGGIKNGIKRIDDGYRCIVSN